MFTSVRPLFYLGKIPITVTGLIILLEIIGMLVCVITGSSILDVTAFQAEAFLHGEVWRLFIYALFSPIGMMAVVGLYFFYQFGSEVEKMLGRKLFVILKELLFQI